MTMLIGLIWLNETYTLISILGILLILIGLTLNVLVKRNNGLKNIFKRSYYTR
jgi:drug/metabolite transporter (DMT)-like permease